jgi:hypothetical protein
VSDAEQDDFGDRDGLDEQEGAIGAEDSQRAFRLAAQSNGNAPVTILMSRRFSSAAAVRRDASHHQAAMIMAKAPTSAAPLNAPRPATRPTSISCRFTIGKRLTVRFSSPVAGRAFLNWVWPANGPVTTC